MANEPKYGAVTNLARAFINSKLTPLLIIATIMLGLFALSLTPREEEPQIVVPMIDVMVMHPGATPEEVESLITRPLEQILWEVEDMEYVYSASYHSFSMVTARYVVGTNMEDASVRLYNKISTNYDRMPPGTLQPLVKVRSIDDVPVLALTLWSESSDGYALRQIAGELKNEIQSIPDVTMVDLIGGRPRTLSILPDPQRMAAFNVTTLSILPALQQANANLPAGMFAQADEQVAVEVGGFLRTAEDVRALVVGTFMERPVTLGDVADIEDGPGEIDSYTFLGVGPAADRNGIDGDYARGTEYPAVTVSVAKRIGSDATRVTDAVKSKVETLQGRLIPGDVHVTVTRDYGATAADKASSLIQNLGLAIFLAVVVIFFAMGWRGALIIFLSIPTTFSLTLFVYYMSGYTLNRVTLFALILVTGIVIDATIIVVENMHRHFKIAGNTKLSTALASIQEVGNPTVMATLTVIASMMPMAFVSGLMGPYMKPMPIGASMAMAFSLLVALVITPWLAIRLLKVQDWREDVHGEGTLGGQHVDEEQGYRLHDTPIYKVYNKVMRPLVDQPRKGVFSLIFVFLLTGAACVLFATRTVQVKMLPFDNKSEFQVIIDTPEGTTLETTTRLAREIGDYIASVPEVTDYQVYAGTASPVNFNGLVRHYFMRQGPNVADLQVNLVDKSERSDQSHAIAKRVRGPIKAIADRYGAAVKIAEVPPGPPVLSTLVCEIYGPDHEGRIAIAEQVKTIFEETPGVVDIDWYVEDPMREIRFRVDQGRAAVRGVSVAQAAQTLAVALNGYDAGLLRVPEAAEPVPLNLRLPLADRSSPEALGELYVYSQAGALVPLSDLVVQEETTIPVGRHRRNLKPVVYVTADVAGELESPVYAILDMRERIAAIELPSGLELSQNFREQPVFEEEYAVKWDGEWHITYEVFRDLGVAFAIVLVLIYLLIVGMFQNFTVPLLMMIPIPLTLVGIVPGHLLFGAFFTATSMIGVIALAGIMVRNSVLLIDFIEAGLREGKELKEACIEAGAVRFLPIALTAGTVVTGSFVMVFDPIFQGMAISLMMGTLLSTILTVIVIPLAYYLYRR